MDIIPFEKVGEYKFNESFEEFKNRLSSFKRVDIGEKVELDKKYPSIYIFDIELFVVFTEDGARIRYIEADQDIYHQGVNLHKEKLSELKKKYSQIDESATFEPEEVNSPLFGIIISGELEKQGNTVLVYSREYEEEDELSPDDIIKYYLG